MGYHAPKFVVRVPGDGGIENPYEIRTEGILTAADYGFVADGEWQHIAIPLADFEAEGVDLTDIEVALMLILEGGAADDMLRIDNVYFTAGDSE